MSLFSKDDYAGALGALLPTGRAWPRASKTVQAAVLRALGSAFQRSDDDAINLIAGAFPPTATSMLPEWEATLGLPDDCAIGEIDGVSDRQRMVVAKLISTGGLNRDYYIRVAAALGYTITITQFRPAMCGLLPGRLTPRKPPSNTHCQVHLTVVIPWPPGEINNSSARSLKLRPRICVLFSVTHNRPQHNDFHFNRLIK